MPASSKKNEDQRLLLPKLVMPILLGLALFLCLFSLIHGGILNDELVIRYIAGHPVSKVTTALFCIGLASLMLILKDVLTQLFTHPKISLGSKESIGETSDNEEDASRWKIGVLLDRLRATNQKYHEHYLWKRLFQALSFVQRNQSADGLDEELKYAAETDQEVKHNRYAFVRIMIWAIPMLGFLGTVLGISEALGGINIGPDNDFQNMMSGLRSSLYVAFDTTAVALTFSILLMFMQFAVDQTESSLLSTVDERAQAELTKHWQVTNQQQDEYVRTVQTMCKQVQDSTEKLVDKQVNLWRTNIQAAQDAWVEGVKGAQSVVQEQLGEALNKSTEELGNNLGTVIRQSDEAIARRWEQWQIALSDNARPVGFSSAGIAGELAKVWAEPWKGCTSWLT